MERLASLPVTGLTGAAKHLYEEIIGGARGKNRPKEDFVNEKDGLRGPFNPLLYTPEIGIVSQKLGEKIRFNSSLPDDVREVAILTVAARWKADYEWWAHEKIGRKTGLSDEFLDAVRNETLSATLSADPVLILVNQMIIELMDHHKVDQDTFEKVKEQIGDTGIVELVLLFGYYTLISATLNTFEIALPPGEEPPFGGS